MKLCFKRIKNIKYPYFHLKNRRKKDRKIYGIYSPVKGFIMVDYKLMISVIKHGVTLSTKSFIIISQLNKKLFK